VNSIFNGDLQSRRGRLLAWADSMLLDHALFRLSWANFAPVVHGSLYRSNHPTPARLAAYARQYGLRTIVNLRGKAGNGSDALSREAASRLGLELIDAPLKSQGAPEPKRVLHLLDAFKRMGKPALLYCKSGADRTGFAAALYLIYQGVGASSACRQLSRQFGYFAHSNAGILRAFIDAYAREAEGKIGLVDWLRTGYDSAALEQSFQPSLASRLLADRLLPRE
jgi:protein tyrosine/serine phosphatase